jgi:hypothetical protein
MPREQNFPIPAQKCTIVARRDGAEGERGLAENARRTAARLTYSKADRADNATTPHGSAACVGGACSSHRWRRSGASR